jgi:uncharacterized protein YllA (UPF0747 family)
VYQQLLGRVTPIVPRFSATLLDAKAEKFLERYQLGVADVLHGPDHVRSLLAERALPAKLRDAFDRLNTSFDESLAGLQHELANLDQTLVDAAQHAGSKMKYQLDRLRARADAAELRRSEVLDRHATYLSNVIFPNKNLQERELGGIYFLARHGKTLLSELDPLVSNRCPDHQVIHI